MYVAVNPISVFDEIQREECRMQAEAMSGTTQSLQDYIEFGRDWKAANSLTAARRSYEQREALRKFAARLEDSRWTGEHG